MRSQRVERALALVLAALFPLTHPSVAAESPPPEADGPPDQAPWLTLGVLGGESDVEGFGDVLAPFWAHEGGIVFVNPRASLNDDSEEEVSVGLGYRHWRPDRALILGANVYYDSRWTQNDNRFDQTGFGGEILSRWADLRGNVYLALDDAVCIDREVTESTQQSTRSYVSESISQSSTASDPFARGHSILQLQQTSYSMSRTLTTETRTTTSRQVFERFEAPLDGWDVEAGVRLPLPDRFGEWRVYGGWYSFDGDYMERVDGFKARAEVRVVPAVSLTAAYYEDDDFFGDDLYIGANVSVPFDFKRDRQLREQFIPGPRPFADRLGEMVVRDPHIRTIETGYIEDLSERRRTDTTKRTSETEEESSASETVLTLMDDIAFVDGDNAGDPFEDGTAEHPFDVFQEGVDAGRPRVFVHDAATTYEENVVLKANQWVRGSGCPIDFGGGRAYGSGVFPNVDGRGGGPAITLASGTELAGFHITNVSGKTHPVNRAGVYGFAVNDVYVHCNRIDGCSNGISIKPQGSFEGRIVNNRITGNDLNGLWIEGQGSSGVFNLLVSDNVFEGNMRAGAAVSAQTYDDATVVFLRNQALGNQGRGITVALFDIANRSWALFGNATAISNEFDGIAFSSSAGESFVSFSDIVSEDNGSGLANGISAWMSSASGSSVALFGAPAAVLSLMGDVPFAPGAEPLEWNPNAAAGPVRTSRNGVGGIQSTAFAAGDSIAGFFDVEASDNENEVGIESGLWSTNGIGANVFASSESLASLLDVVRPMAGFFGIDLSGVVLPSNGPLRANRNEDEGGIFARTTAPTGANVFLGVEANGNVGPASHGIQSVVDGASLGLALFGRVEAVSNRHDNLHSRVEGDDFALGLFADIRANESSFADGVNSRVVSSNGWAAAAFLSTDLLRAIIPAINATGALPFPIGVPGGAPFGPSETIGNFANGIASGVEGKTGAAGIYLDLRANDNDQFGIVSGVASAEGPAASIFASSDRLLQLAKGFQSEFPPELAGLNVPTGSMGPMEANRNRFGGIQATTRGRDSSLAAFAGVEASDNRPNGTANGIHSEVVSAAGESMNAVLWTEANRNQQSGIVLSSTSKWDSAATVVDSTASGNTSNGVSVAVGSASGDTGAWFAGVTANGNRDGIVANLVSTVRDAEADFTAVRTETNSFRGIAVYANGGDDAGAEFSTNVVGMMDVSVLTNLTPEVIAMIPYGPTRSVGNASTGIQLDFTAADEAWLHGERIIASGNNLGLSINATALNYSLDLGGGWESGAGLNSLFGNVGGQVNNGAAATLLAENNWWGAAPPNAALILGTVDFVPWLLSDPN